MKKFIPSSIPSCLLLAAFPGMIAYSMVACKHRSQAHGHDIWAWQVGSNSKMRRQFEGGGNQAQIRT